MKYTYDEIAAAQKIIEWRDCQLMIKRIDEELAHRHYRVRICPRRKIVIARTRRKDRRANAPAREWIHWIIKQQLPSPYRIFIR